MVHHQLPVVTGAAGALAHKVRPVTGVNAAEALAHRRHMSCSIVEQQLSLIESSCNAQPLEGPSGAAAVVRRQLAVAQMLSLLSTALVHEASRIQQQLLRGDG